MGVHFEKKMPLAFFRLVMVGIVLKPFERTRDLEPVFGPDGVILCLVILRALLGLGWFHVSVINQFGSSLGSEVGVLGAVVR